MAKNWTKRLIGRALFLTTSTAAMMGIAHGQEQTAAAGGDEEIVVTAPLRDSLERSLLEQRNADNIVNVIAADTLGQFPDSTAAGALARLPGVGVQRDQGQERYIQIRGAPTRWTTVALDDINVLGAEDRIFRFDSVPSVQINQLELNKTLLADMPAESLAGRVNIQTYSPLDNPGFSAYLDGGYGFGDLGYGPVKNYAARLSWANDVFGISVTGSHFSFEQHTDNSEPRFNDATITQLRITKYVITRQTESYSLALQYQPNPNHRFSMQHLYTEFNDFEERNQYRWEFNRAVSGSGDFNSGSFVGVPVVSTWEEGIYSNGVTFTRLRGEHEFGQWLVDWDVASTQTEFNTWTPLVSQSTSNFTARPTLASDILNLNSINVDINAEPGGIPTLTLFDTVSNGAGGYTFGARRVGLDSYSLNSSIPGEFSSVIETEALTVKADISHPFSAFGAEGEFSAGFQYDDREQESFSFSVVSGFGTLEARAAALGVPWNTDDFGGLRAWDTNFPFGYTATYVNTEAMFDALGVLREAYIAANGVDIFRAGATDVVGEEILAGYVQVDFDWDRHSLVAGVRVERTEIETTGLLSGAAFQATAEDTQFFPQLYYTYDYSDDIKLRAAFISGQARPSLTDMRASVSVNDTADTVSGGNPNLTPERAYGIDLSAEWYFGSSSLLSVSAYHREVSDVLFDASEFVGDNRFDSNGVDRSGYVFSSTLNGGDGYLSGIEFVYYQPWDFLPGWLSGFGFQGSAAFVQGEFDAPDFNEATGVTTFSTVEFPGTSDRIFNAVLFYENYGISARLVYQWRSDWLDEVFPSGSAANSNLFWDETQRLDASLRYQINENFSAYMDATNILNEYGVRYQGVENRPYEVESFGRRFIFGVRANF